MPSWLALVTALFSAKAVAGRGPADCAQLKQRSLTATVPAPARPAHMYLVGFKALAAHNDSFQEDPDAGRIRPDYMTDHDLIRGLNDELAQEHWARVHGEVALPGNDRYRSQLTQRLISAPESWLDDYEMLVLEHVRGPWQDEALDIIDFVRTQRQTAAVGARPIEQSDLLRLSRLASHRPEDPTVQHFLAQQMEEVDTEVLFNFMRNYADTPAADLALGRATARLEGLSDSAWVEVDRGWTEKLQPAPTDTLFRRMQALSMSNGGRMGEAGQRGTPSTSWEWRETYLRHHLRALADPSRAEHLRLVARSVRSSELAEMHEALEQLGRRDAPLSQADEGTLERVQDVLTRELKTRASRTQSAEYLYEDFAGHEHDLVASIAREHFWAKVPDPHLDPKRFESFFKVDRWGRVSQQVRMWSDVLATRDDLPAEIVRAVEQSAVETLGPRQVLDELDYVAGIAKGRERARLLAPRDKFVARHQALLNKALARTLSEDPRASTELMPRIVASLDDYVRAGQLSGVLSSMPPSAHDRLRDHLRAWSNQALFELHQKLPSDLRQSLLGPIRAERKTW